MAQRHAELLKSARNEIHWGLEEYTCIAIRNRAPYQIGGYKASAEIRKWIDDALGGPSTLDRWLSKQGYDCGSTGMYYQQFLRKVKETRLAWIDWMIDNHHVFD